MQYGGVIIRGSPSKKRTARVDVRERGADIAAMGANRVTLCRLAVTTLVPSVGHL